MNRHLIELPPPEAWPPADELIGRKELAALLQVPVEAVRFWERTGLMPPRAALPERGFAGLPESSLARLGPARMAGEAAQDHFRSSAKAAP